MTKKIKAVVSDLDGTLLDPNGEISDFTCQVLQAINKLGIELLIATGRHPLDARRNIQKLNIKPVIFGCNGGLCICTSTGHAIIDLVFDRSMFQQLCSFIQQLDIHVSIFDRQGWKVTEENSMVIKYSDKFNFPYETITHEDIKNISANKLLLWTEKNICHYESIINIRFGHLIECYRSSLYTLEIVPKSVSKLASSRHYLQQKSIDFGQNVIAFGDAMNDAAMLAHAATGVIMENAMPELFAMFDKPESTLSNANDGVAHYLHNKFLL